MKDVVTEVLHVLQVIVIDHILDLVAHIDQDQEINIDDEEVVLNLVKKEKEAEQNLEIGRLEEEVVHVEEVVVVVDIGNSYSISLLLLFV